MKERLIEWQQRIEAVLERCLPSADHHPTILHQAMRYATLDGGKRVRPVLCYAAGEALNIPLTQLDAPAAAVEMIHVYSLIHDDLPAMDDDDLRRGKPTVHKAFDEAMAILAGDALQSQAFLLLASDDTMVSDANARLNVIRALSEAAGSIGMCGGQAIDLSSVGKPLTLEQLEDMHLHKTGALIRSAVRMAAYSRPDLDDNSAQQLDHYARCIGLAFQVRDDILDIESDTETLGKPQGSDVAQDKPTYPALMGIDAAKTEAQRLYSEAIDALHGLPGDTRMLRWVADYIVQREK